MKDDEVSTQSDNLTETAYSHAMTDKGVAVEETKTGDPSFDQVFESRDAVADEEEDSVLLEEVALEAQAETFLLMQKLEAAIDGHLRVESENESWKKRNDEDRKLERLSLKLKNENARLLEEKKEKEREIAKVKQLIENLQVEEKKRLQLEEKMRQNIPRHNEIIDLTNM